MNRFAYTVVAAAVVLAGVVFATTLAHALWFAPEMEVAPPATHETKVAIEKAASGDAPVRLKIPSLNIDASVQQVGIAKSGKMAVPNNYTDVAWYKYGPVPGALGSAVMDGHVDNGLALDGVFKHLSDIKVGDKIEVVNKDGKTLEFIVSDIQSYPYQQVPVEVIFNQKDTARLNLITCEGNWVQGDKTYDERLVVYATLS